MVENVTTATQSEFVAVTPGTVLESGRFELRVTIPSSRFTRSTQIEVSDGATVASIERNLSDHYGECVEVVTACCIQRN
jgi:ribosomal protein L18E